jgi:hypothetical protein
MGCGTVTLSRGVYSIAKTKRRRFLWCVWWSGEPTVKPFRMPDAWGGGADTEDEARELAERAAGMPLQQIDGHWAAGFKRLRAGLEPFVTREPRVVEAARADAPLDPHAVLGVTAANTLDEVKTAFRKKALEHHPDTGGSAAGFIALKRAYDSILKRRARRGDR